MIEKIIEFSLRNRLFLLVVSMIIMVAGVFSYKQLPVDAFPDVSPNLVQVFTITEGLAPEEIEQYITYPVEAAMNGLPGISKIRSVSNFGLSVVNVYFEDDVDIYFARRLVDERLGEAREQIPDGFGEPSMGPISTGMGLILFYYLEDETGEYSLEELRSIQDWLVKFHLQTVPGVTEVLGIGGYEKQFQVNVHPEGLLRYNISLSDIIETIRNNNLNVGAQFIERDAEELVVRSVGLAYTIEDLKNIILKSENGTPIFLSQVANIEIGGAVRRGVQTYNGISEVVSGMVVKLFGANSSTVIEAVETKMVEINKLLPDGIKLIPYYEQKTLVEACVKTVSDALLQGMVLVVIILMIFLGGFRPSLVAALSIPFSVLFAFIGMKQFGISANLMSFGGLAIAIGMLVDGAVVMVENTQRLLQSASPTESRISIVAKACKEVGRPIAFAIFIIIVVFIPLFTLSGVEGKTFKPLAYTVSLAMFGSLLFALFIAPVLSSLLMRRPKNKLNKINDKSNVTQLNDVNEKGIMRWLLIPYKPILKFLLARRYMAIVIILLLLSIGAVIYPQLGSEFTPTLQEGTLVMRLTMAPSISLTESTRITQIVERRLMKIEEITGVVTRIGRGEVGAHTDPINSAEMYIILKPRHQWESANSQQELREQIREKVGNVLGALTTFTQPIQMTVDELLEGVRAELAIKVFGDNLDSLKIIADEIALIVSDVPGAVDVQPDQISGTPQLLIKIDRQAIARYGINVADVQEVIKAAVGGEIAGQIFEGVKRFDILVRYQKSYRDTPDAIGQILVQTPEGAWIPLSELTTIEEVVGPRQITRENNQRFVSIQCNVIGRDITSFVNEAQKAIDSQVELPVGYLTTWGGQFRLQQEANKKLAVVIPITLLFVFLLLFSSFNSIKSSLLIFLNLPLTLVGGIVALWVTGQNLSVPASVGFIALFGIALENGMVLITYINQLVKDGMSCDEASIQGASLRLRAVLMTATTTGLGLIPLIFSQGIGSEVQRPLATVVVGGLVTSTIITLLVLPVIYKWFNDSETQRTSYE